MTILIGALALGLILSLLSTGVYISYRVFGIADITVDGSITLGGAVTAILLSHHFNPWLVAAFAFFAGMIAGLITGYLHTGLKINSLLSGILVMTALYSINLHVMGRSNVPILGERSIITGFESIASLVWKGKHSLDILGWPVPAKDVAVAGLILSLVAVLTMLLYLFFRTRLGAAMRATGDNPQMIRALGVNTKALINGGLALSNGLVALSGCLLAQYQGFADVQMGIGMIVLGLASLIIGESVIGKKSTGYLLCGVIMGTILFRMLVALALRWGMNPNDLKLVTAVFVLGALILPQTSGWLRKNQYIRHVKD